MQNESANSFNDVYTSYYRKSFLFVKSYVHDELVAEDIVSESLIKLWERIKCQPVENVQSFLFTILKNKALDHLRHEAVQREVYKSLIELHKREHELRITMLQACEPNEMFSSEIHKILHTTLISINQKSRKIFELSRFENKTNKEIAKIFNISVKGVDYHIALTINELRIKLKDYLPSF